MSGPFGQGPSHDSGPFGNSGATGNMSPFGNSAAPAAGSSPFTARPASAPDKGPGSGAAGSSGAGSLDYSTGPKGLLFAALATAVVGLVLSLVPVLGPMTATSASWAALAAVAWVLCGIVSFILLGLYTIRDNALRAATVYVAQDAQTVLYRVALGLGGVGVVITAFELALWASKL